MTNLSRSLYRCLVQLHPPAFRRQFAPEMLWIFDEIADHEARVELFTDALTSLARQWIVREMIQKLLIGELRFGPLPATGSGQFSWERIEFDDRPLPPPRVIQGGIVAFIFFTLIAMAAVQSKAFHRVSVGANGAYQLLPVQTYRAAMAPKAASPRQRPLSRSLRKIRHPSSNPTRPMMDDLQKFPTRLLAVSFSHGSMLSTVATKPSSNNSSKSTTPPAPTRKHSTWKCNFESKPAASSSKISTATNRRPRNLWESSRNATPILSRASSSKSIPPTSIKFRALRSTSSRGQQNSPSLA